MYLSRAVEPAIFLDRDNTLIANDGDLGDPHDVRLLDGVPDGLRRLREAGYRLVVVTNQAGVARGQFTEDDVDAVHQRIANLIDEQAEARRLIDRFYYCPYHPNATNEAYRRDHPWRKPHPGMLLQATRDLGIDLSQSWVIGDQTRDVQAGDAAGCRTVLVNGKHEMTHEGDNHSPTAVVSCFSEAVETVLRSAAPVPETHNDVNEMPRQGEAVAETSTGPQRRSTNAPSTDEGALRRAIHELTEEVRSERIRRSEFTGFRLTAALCQMLVVVLVVLGLMQLQSTDVFMKWMAVALIGQLVTMTLLLLDSR